MISCKAFSYMGNDCKYMASTYSIFFWSEYKISILYIISSVKL